MASLGGELQILTNSQPAESVTKSESREESLVKKAEAVTRSESREGSLERKVSKDRDEKLKIARERQNEERQRKIEELKAQAEAAQRYREQKEEERRRRIDEIRHRDTEKRQQVEERKKAIMEAEKERREYILKKNQERESRLETKKKEKSSIGFAFGSSTPRLLEPADFGMVSPSTFWGHRRSTSISNVAGASLSRRSSERELADCSSKKRATSASGTERHDEDKVDASHIIFRSVARRKTDLMPTIPSPRDGHYGSRSSLSNTPRTPGRAFSMNRLDQLAQPIRRNGEHIRAILERERREQQIEMLDETESLGGGRRISKNGGGSGSSMSRSMSHLASGRKYNLGGGISSSFRPLSSGNKDSCKSMTQLANSWSTPPRSNLGLQTAATKKYLQSSFASPSTKRGQHFTNTYRYDPNSLLLMSSSFITTGSRSGNVTPGGSINTSRPGSAMSTSTNMSSSGYVPRRSGPPMRKPRPASIAGTGVSLEEINKLKKENKPPVKSSTPLSAQTTPKRTPNLMSSSMIVTSSSSRLSSSEKKTPSKRDSYTPKTSTPKSLSKTSSSDRLNKESKEQKPTKNASSSMTKSSITISSTTVEYTEATQDQQLATPVKSKDEKNAINTVKTEEPEIVVVVKPQEENILIGDNISHSVADEKMDHGNEKDSDKQIKAEFIGTKETQEARELTPPSQFDSSDLMSASMIAKNKITTEEEAKAALAERRRLAREEAERQAELERQRLEAERLAEIKQQEEEAERQRQFEEEAMRLAAEQRRAEEERLRQAIEEAKQREEEERMKREEEEKQRIEREEAEKKAKEEAEKQRLEVAERLKREEKEREERRKRVEAIMSRTRKAGSAVTPNSTPVKENTEQANSTPSRQQNQQNETQQLAKTQNSSSTEESNSTSGSNTSTTTPTISGPTSVVVAAEPQNSQAMYEQSVEEKEVSLMKTFSTVNEENLKNMQQINASQQQQPVSQSIEKANGKIQHTNDVLFHDPNKSVANGNGHFESINNKNDINILQDAVVPVTNRLIDFSIESQDLNNSLNFNNNNSLLSTTNTLVTADSHENKDISLL